MDDTLRHIADDADSWMEGGLANANQNCWVVLDGEEDALDLAFALARMRGVPKDKAEVRYDKPPILVGVNAKTGRCLWILSQPNHLPTIEVSMNKVVSKIRQGEASRSERAKYSKILEQAGGDPNKDLAGNPLTLSSGRNERLFEPMTPDWIICDQREPMWDTLSEFITEDTDLTLTGRVQRRPSSKQEIIEHEPDSDRKLGRYDPEAD